MRTVILELMRNACFWAAFCAWMAGQCTKMLIAHRTGKRVDLRFLVSTGGMPSAHSSMVSGLATSVGLREGFDSSIFAVSLGFALIVMFDASTVRRAAGAQAKLLNEIIDEMFHAHRLSERKLAELLGHTRLEVAAGMIMGILMALLICSLPQFCR